MKVKLKAQSRVLVLPGIVNVSKAEADRLFLLGIAEKVIEEQKTAEEQPKEQPKEEPKPKKRTRKARA